MKRENVRMCSGYNAPLLNCLGEVKESDFYNTWSNLQMVKHYIVKNVLIKCIIIISKKQVRQNPHYISL